MLNLKAELVKKQQEFKNEKSKSTTSYIPTKDKTGIKKKPLAWMKTNVGVEERNKRDLEYNEEEVDKLSKVQTILEAKAKMYEKMTSGNVIPDDETNQLFLVDFEQKSVDAWRSKREQGESSIKPEVNVSMGTEVKKTINDAKEQWVDYVDALGRTRTCLKKDLPKLEKIDEKLSSSVTTEKRTLMSDDMRREEERKKWEEEASIETEQGPVHFENVRFGENREYGVGYYAFSGEQEKRQEQMQRLNKLREDTEKQKHVLKEKKAKETTALEARLEKVRQRRIKKLQKEGKDIPPSLLEPVQLKKEEEKLEEIQPVETTPVKPPSPKLPFKLREWDKDKESPWRPAEAPKAPRGWEDPREQRPNEFAPPSSYFREDNGSRKRSGAKQTADNHKQQRTGKNFRGNCDLETRQSRTSSDICENVGGNLGLESPPIPAKSDDSERIQRLMDEIAAKHNPVASQSAVKEPTVSAAKDDTVPEDMKEAVKPEIVETEMKPFVPTEKPITLTVKARPKKTLVTKSAFND